MRIKKLAALFFATLLLGSFGATTANALEPPKAGMAAPEQSNSVQPNQQQVAPLPPESGSAPQSASPVPEGPGWEEGAVSAAPASQSTGEPQPGGSAVQSGPAANSQSGAQRAAPATADEVYDLQVKIPMNITSYSVNFSYRVYNSGAQWRTVDFVNSSTRATLETGTEYEYVINNAHSDSIYYKISGVLSWDGIGEVANHLLYDAGRINQILSVATAGGNATLTVLDFLNVNIGRRTGYSTYLKTNPTSHSRNFVMYDEDGTVWPPFTYRYGWSAYGFLLARHKTYTYKVEGAGILPATGQISANGGMDDFAVSDMVNNTCTPEPYSMIQTFVLQRSEGRIQLRNLIRGTAVHMQGETDLTARYDAGQQTIHYEFGAGKTVGTVTATIAREGCATITLPIAVKNDNTFAIDPAALAAATADASEIVADPDAGRIDIHQMAVGVIQMGPDGVAQVEFPALPAIVNMNKVFNEQINHYWGSLRVENPTAGDAYFKNMRPRVANENVTVLRSPTSKRMLQYYREFVPGYENAAYITPQMLYNFAAIAGKPYAEALLYLYQNTGDASLRALYGNITSLSELPAAEVRDNIISSALVPYTADDLGGDLSAPHMYPIGNNEYFVRETDPELLALYSQVLYSSVVGVTLDNGLYRCGDWNVQASPWGEGILLGDYAQGTPENKRMLAGIRAAYPAVPAGGHVDFRNFRMTGDTFLLRPPTHTANLITDISFTFDFLNGPVNSYEVAYHGNGNDAGTAPSDPQTLYLAMDRVTVLPKGDLAKAGATFEGWNTRADGTGTPYRPGDSFLIQSDTDLYAMWDLPLYTLRFNTHGGAPAPGSQTLAAGQLATKPPAAPQKQGHSFTGWYTGETGGRRWDFAADTMPNADLTLHARYRVISYIVTFVHNNGDASTTQNVEFGALVVKPGDPLKRAHRFMGWAAKDGHMWDFAAETMPARNLTLYAQWQPLTYTVTYMSEGRVFDTRAVLPGALIPNLTPPPVAGHIFHFWALGGNAATPWNMSGDRMPEHNIMVAAMWQVAPTPSTAPPVASASPVGPAPGSVPRTPSSGNGGFSTVQSVPAVRSGASSGAAASVSTARASSGSPAAPPSASAPHIGEGPPRWFQQGPQPQCGAC